MSKQKQRCPECQGDGWNVEAECCGFPEDGVCCNIPTPRQVQCDYCRGEGTIPVEQI